MKTRFSARIQIYLRKYVNLFPQICANISRNSHTYFRKYVYVFAEINSAGREMMFWNAFCVDLIQNSCIFIIYGCSVLI